MSINALACIAMSFLRDHEAEHLTHDRPRLVDRCITHLVEKCAVSKDKAKTATVQAYGELTARHSKVSIDCGRTTSFTLFMTDEQGNQIVLLAADVARLAKSAPVMLIA